MGFKEFLGESRFRKEVKAVQGFKKKLDIVEERLKDDDGDNAVLVLDELIKEMDKFLDNM